MGMYSMALSKRLDVEKGKYSVRFKEFEGGDVACMILVVVNWGILSVWWKG